MSLADLHDLAAKLHANEEAARRERRVRPAEFDLLAKTVLQAVHEMANLEERLAALESKSSQSD